jgi:hypothetical protein
VIKAVVQIYPTVGSGFQKAAFKVLSFPCLPKIGDTLWLDGGEYDNGVCEVTEVDFREYKGSMLVFIYADDEPRLGSFEAETMSEMGWTFCNAIGECEHLLYD